MNEHDLQTKMFHAKKHTTKTTTLKSKRTVPGNDEITSQKYECKKKQ
jgi:hypothetical protein